MLEEQFYQNIGIAVNARRYVLINEDGVGTMLALYLCLLAALTMTRGA